MVTQKAGFTKSRLPFAYGRYAEGAMADPEEVDAAVRRKAYA